MPLNIENTFINGTPAVASEVNANFASVKTFVDLLQNGTGIDNDAITAAKLADNAVTQAKIADSSVSQNKLADNAVTQAKVADRAVGSAELAQLSLTTVTTTPYPPVLTDAQKIVVMNSSSPMSFTVPTDAVVAFQIGDQINVLQLGLGAVTFSAVTPATTTVVAQGGKLKTNGQYSMATLVKVAANQWVVVGNLTV